MISYACESHTGLHLCGADFKTAANRHHGLQQEVLHSLPADQDILHVKSLADWEDILKSPRNNTITVDADNIMVAQSLAIHPTLTDQASAADMLDMELPGEPHTLSTFCAVMTHPAHRGRHLMQRMMDEWIYWDASHVQTCPAGPNFYKLALSLQAQGLTHRMIAPYIMPIAI
jgi:hypothetical protein